MQETCAIAILAGGEGRRLGRADKALVSVGGKPMLALALDRVRPQARHILLSANGDPQRFSAFGLPVVADAQADAGPLAGIAAAAGYCARHWPDVQRLISLPVDVPCPPADLAARLLQSDAAKVAVAEADGRRQWAIACWPMPAAQALASAIAAGTRRIEDAVRATGWQAVPFAEAAAFRNVNTPADLAELERALTQF